MCLFNWDFCLSKPLKKSTFKSKHSSAFVEMDILKLSNTENILLAVTSNLKKIYSYYYAAKEDGQLNIE